MTKHWCTLRTQNNSMHQGSIFLNICHVTLYFVRTMYIVHGQMVNKRIADTYVTRDYRRHSYEALQSQYDFLISIKFEIQYAGIMVLIMFLISKGQVFYSIFALGQVCTSLQLMTFARPYRMSSFKILKRGRQNLTITQNTF